MKSSVGTTASVGEASRRLDFYCDQTEIGPVKIERDGATGVVMMAAPEYERLARLDHVALLPCELEDDDLAAIRSAVVAEHICPRPDRRGG